MKLRFKDYLCYQCKQHQEIMMDLDRDPIPRCCGVKMKEIWISGPGIHYKPHYSHALGKRVDRYREEELALEKKGQWIASKSEANSNYGTDRFDDNVVVKRRREEEIRKHVEKQAQKLVADGRISFAS